MDRVGLVQLFELPVCPLGSFWSFAGDAARSWNAWMLVVYTDTEALQHVSTPDIALEMSWSATPIIRSRKNYSTSISGGKSTVYPRNYGISDAAGWWSCSCWKASRASAYHNSIAGRHQPRGQGGRMVWVWRIWLETLMPKNGTLHASVSRET